MHKFISILLVGLLGAAEGVQAQQPHMAALAGELPRLMQAGDVPGLSVAVPHGAERS